ncbi:hypothetical protein D3C80_1932160 [compost metagenome]
MTLGHRSQVCHQQLQRGVTHCRTLKVLRGIEFDGAVPVTRPPGYPSFFTETGNAQFQRVAETIDAQLTRLLKGFAGSSQQVGSRIGL